MLCKDLDCLLVSDTQVWGEKPSEVDDEILDVNNRPPPAHILITPLDLITPPGLQHGKLAWVLCESSSGEISFNLSGEINAVDRVCVGGRKAGNLPQKGPIMVNGGRPGRRALVPPGCPHKPEARWGPGDGRGEENPPP